MCRTHENQTTTESDLEQELTPRPWPTGGPRNRVSDHGTAYRERRSS